MDCPNKPCYLCKKVYTIQPLFPCKSRVAGVPHAPGRRATTQGIVRFGNLRGLVRGEEEAGEEAEEEEEEEEEEAEELDGAGAERCGSL